MSKVVLFGATGYTGRLAARALQARGISPLLAGRDPTRLRALANELGGLPHAVADAEDPGSLVRLLGAGDVLVSTVGPFLRYGAAQVEAVLAQRAHYLDSCGEPAYYRLLIERYSERARAAGSALLSACAYDFFAGNCVADHVLQLAGPAATRVVIGYAGDLAPGYRTSAGSQASGMWSMLEPGLFWRDGRFVAEPIGQRLGRFELHGAQRPGFSMPGTEPLFLPELHPKLRDIEAYWGWAGSSVPAMHVSFRAIAALARFRPARAVLQSLFRKLAKSDGTGPDANLRERSASYVCAAAFDAAGQQLAAAELGDIDGFDFTANILAWSADVICRGELQRTGVTGPVQAFGREALRRGHAEAGFELSVTYPRKPQPSAAVINGTAVSASRGMES